MSCEKFRQCLGVNLQLAMADNNAENPDSYYKVVVLGDAGVGKTALILKYVYDAFNPTQVTTVGMEFLFKKVAWQNRVLKLQIWDTVGQEKFAPLAESFCRNADAVILCYDITTSKTFYNIEKWIDDYPMLNNPLMMLVGCKSDIEADREISTELGQEKATDLELPFFEVSVLNDTNVAELFDFLVSNLALREPNCLRKKSEIVLSGGSVGSQRTRKCKC